MYSVIPTRTNKRYPPVYQYKHSSTASELSFHIGQILCYDLNTDTLTTNTPYIVCRGLPYSVTEDYRSRLITRDSELY